MRVAVDTNSISEFFKGNSSIRDFFDNNEHIYIPYIVLAELYAGFRFGTHEEKNRQQLETLFDTFSIEILFPDSNTIEYYASIYSQLRRKGKPIPTNDIWIAAISLQHDLTLFTFDGHFGYVEGLSVTTK